jgi:hypothetical protein
MIDFFTHPHHRHTQTFEWLKEAMAMGMCVVAENQPTANEHILSGKNGILYAGGEERIYPPRRVESAELARMGRKARETIRRRLLPEWNPVFWQSDDEFYRFGAVTPRSNCILDTTKIIKAGIRIRSAGEAIEDALNHWVTEKKG